MSESHEVVYLECDSIEVSGGFLTFRGKRVGDDDLRFWNINLGNVESYSTVNEKINIVYTNEEDGGEPLN